MGSGMIIGWLILILIVYILFYVFTSSKKLQSDKSPQEILDERFAKGEIDEKEYKEKSDLLKNQYV